MAVEARGEARCCKPADWSHRAMTASPASPLWSNRAAAAALPCGIWPLAWRCERRWGANFQDLFARAAHRTNRRNQDHAYNNKKSKRKWKKIKRRGSREEHERCENLTENAGTVDLWNGGDSDLKRRRWREWTRRIGIPLAWAIMAEEGECTRRRERNPLNGNFGD